MDLGVAKRGVGYSVLNSRSFDYKLPDAFGARYPPKDKELNAPKDPNVILMTLVFCERTGRRTGDEVGRGGLRDEALTRMRFLPHDRPLQ